MRMTGLSLDQAPPIAIPFTFFFTASLFSLLAGLIVTLAGEQLSISRWTPAALALTHAVTVGFLLQVMAGAVVQLLPVLMGAPVPSVVRLARWIHAALLAGAALLVFGFLRSDYPVLVGGAGLCTAGIVLLFIAITRALLRIRGRIVPHLAFSLGWIALIPTVLLGVEMVLGLAGLISLDDLPQRVRLHLSWGLLGWLGIVLFAILFQLLPVFYITSTIAEWVTRWIPPLMFALLLTLSLAGPANPQTGRIALVLLAVIASLLAFAALRLLQGRKRTLVDATLRFLYTGLLSVPVAAGAWLAGADAVTVGLLLLGGVCLTLPIGMFYKIVPFLCWFHLQSLQMAQGRSVGRIPSMKDFISERQARYHYYLHLVSLLLLLAAMSAYDGLMTIGGVSYSLSSLFLLVNLYRALSKFLRHARRLSVAASDSENPTS